jgi:RHS repeat-associated protein
MDTDANITATLDVNGNVVERYAYDPFSNITVYDVNGNVRPAGTSYAWQHYHQGLRYDATVTLYDNRLRWYDPDLGRFASNDPIGFAAGDANLYRAIGNSIGNGLDPSGLVPAAPDIEVVRAIDDVIRDMQQSNWKPADPKDNGAFGKEVHARVSKKLGHKPRWLSVDVYVQSGTNKILSIGKPPAQGVKGSTQVDLLYLKKGYTPKVGEVLDHTKIEELYDIKATLNGKCGAKQLQRLKDVRNGWPEIMPDNARPVKVVASNQRYTPGRGWHADPRFTTAIRVFSAIMIVAGIASSANAMVHSADYDHELQDIFQESERIRGQGDDVLRRADSVLLLTGKVRTYLSHFIPDENVLNIAVGKAVIKIMGEDLDR